jgi:cytochrome c oxidase cbb3-type subunit IV
VEIGTWRGLWTLALMIVFVAICAWAWSRRRRRDFEEAANLPLEEEMRGPGSTPDNGESR